MVVRLLCLVVAMAPATLCAQRLEDFVTKTPVAPGDYLIIGFLGGRDRWSDETKGVRRLAVKLRTLGRSDVHVETVENTKRRVAIELIRRALDRNQDGKLDEEERSSARLILYGQSFGGAAVVKLARQLQQMDLPVLLTVQIDSVGRGDAVIPSNVRKAANLYQRDGWIIRGEPDIRAQDAQRTKIRGNFRFTYKKKPISLAGVPWYKRILRTAHTKMEHDPEVWAKVEEFIREAIRGEEDARLKAAATVARPNASTDQACTTLLVRARMPIWVEEVCLAKPGATPLTMSRGRNQAWLVPWGNALTRHRSPLPFLINHEHSLFEGRCSGHRFSRIAEVTRTAGLWNRAGYSMAMCVSVRSTPSSD